MDFLFQVGSKALKSWGHSTFCRFLVDILQEEDSILLSNKDRTVEVFDGFSSSKLLDYLSFEWLWQLIFV